MRGVGLSLCPGMVPATELPCTKHLLSARMLRAPHSLALHRFYPRLPEQMHNLSTSCKTFGKPKHINAVMRKQRREFRNCIPKFCNLQQVRASGINSDTRLMLISFAFIPH